MPTYPLIGPNVQSIFEYIRFEEEDIHLGTFEFDYVPFFDLPVAFNYNIDFETVPAQQNPDGSITYNNTHGIIYTCDATCLLAEQQIELTVDNANLIIGAAIRVLNGSTKDNATLIAVVNDPIRNQIILSKWVNQSLAAYGGILAIIDGSLNVGDRLKIRSPSPNVYDILVNDVIILTRTDNTILTTNQCVGIIELAFEITKNIKIGNDSQSDTYSSRRFYYCDDGISVVTKFIPINTGVDLFTSNIDVFLKSGRDEERCYGFYYGQGFSNSNVAGASGRGYYIEGQFIYGPVISGSPISGPTFRIDESKSDPDDFTGWAVLINERDGKIQLAYYLNESLFDLPLPSHIVASVTKHIQPGTKIFFSASMAADIASSLWTILVKTQQPTEGQVTDIAYVGANQLPVGEQLVNRQARTNMGLAWVGVSAFGNHVAEWQGLAPDVYAIIH